MYKIQSFTKLTAALEAGVTLHQSLRQLSLQQGKKKFRQPLQPQAKSPDLHPEPVLYGISLVLPGSLENQHF